MLAKGGGSAGGNSEMQEVIQANQMEMVEMQKTWYQRLAEAKALWEQNAAVATDPRIQTNCYLQNVNEDPQLSGVIRHIVLEGKCMVGHTKTGATPPVGFEQKISLGGLSIQPEHAIFQRQRDHVTLTPLGGAHVSNSFPFFFASRK